MAGSERTRGGDDPPGEDDVENEAATHSVETPRERPDGRARAWPWMIATAVIYWVAQWIGLPGVDHAEIAQMMDESGGLVGLFGAASATVPVLGMSLSTLVLVHVVLMVAGRAEHGSARRIGAAVYLGLSAIQAYGVVLWLESLSGMGFYFDVVNEPGWGFRLKGLLALTAGAAILWWCASRIDATRRAHGALFLLLVATVPTVLTDAWATGSAVGLGVRSAIAALASLGVPIALTLAGGAVALRPPTRWPVRVVFGIELRSAWDALGLVLLGGLPGQAIAAAAVMARPDAATGWMVALEHVAIVLIGAGFAVWWWRRDRGATRAASRPRWALIAPLLLAIATVGSITAGFAAIGGFEQLTTTGPLTGEHTFDLVLEADGRFARTDADAMLRRLDELGAEAELIDEGARRITLRVTAIGPQRVLEALEPRGFGIHLLGPAIDPSLHAPPGITRDAIAYTDSQREVFEGTCDAIRAWRETLEPRGCLWAVEELAPEHAVDPEPASTCQLSCFDPTPVLTSEHIAEADVAVEPQLQAPVVTMELDEEGARRMGEATRANLRRPLAIVVDGDALSVPIIQSEIGARVQITLGYGRDPNAQLEEANALALALRPGAHISTTWTAVEIRD